MILQGTLTLTVCFFFLFLWRGKGRKVSPKIILKFGYIHHPSTVKLFSLVQRKHIFKSLQVCAIIEGTLEFQTKLVI